jgi:hypothetical protein
MKPFSIIFILVMVQLASSSCIEPPATKNPPNYNLSKPIIYKMPAVLDEISGIALNHGNTDTIFAEQDEEGKLFYFHLGDTEVKHTKFYKRGDYEDVTICNGIVIMLQSNGVFFTFPLAELANKSTGNVDEQTGLLPAGEYESLYADEASNSIYTLCKNCDIDKSTQTVTGHIFSMAAGGKLTLKNQISIAEKPIAEMNGREKFKLKPSALARSPITHQWYILSSVEKLLVITDAKWKPIALYPLNPSLFTQPEGIVFDKTGNLYISNEKGGGTSGTILKFLYQKK